MTEDTQPRNGRRSAPERREELIDAALHVLVHEGFLAVTTRRITQQAGLALGAFHYVFRDKSEMLAAIISRTANHAAKILTEAVEPGDNDLLAVAERLVRVYWTHVTTLPDNQLAQYELIVHALRDPQLQHLANLQQEGSTHAVLAVFDRFPATVPAVVRDDVARYLVAAVDGLVLHYIVERDTAAAERRLELFIATLPAVLQAALRAAGHQTPSTSS